MIQQYTSENTSNTNRRRRIILRLTVDILELINKINPIFKKDLMFKPARTLTHPSEPSTNAGYDNIMKDYILRVNHFIGDEKRYKILEYMGRGAFGQVVKCKKAGSNTLVAVKITKRDSFFHQQSQREIKFLKLLNQQSDEKKRILQLHDCFVFRGHQCTVIELLSTNILEFFQQLTEKPRLTMDHVQYIAKQILETLSILKKCNIIHADIKPDNILFINLDIRNFGTSLSFQLSLWGCKDAYNCSHLGMHSLPVSRVGDTRNVKLVDFGSAMHSNEPLRHPIQSPRYRAPEVIFRSNYSFPIDMWSFGCFVTELFLGEGLFPNADEMTVLSMMVSLLGCRPPEEMLDSYQKSRLSFIRPRNDQFNLEKRIMSARSDDIFMTIDKESIELFIDFLKKILVFNPNERLTPDEALEHGFILKDHSKAIKLTIPKSTVRTSVKRKH